MRHPSVSSRTPAQPRPPIERAFDTALAVMVSVSVSGSVIGRQYYLGLMIAMLVVIIPLAALAALSRQRSEERRAAERRVAATAKVRGRSGL